jgi:hypothetical protein
VWIVRELSRLLVRIAVAVAIAALVAGVRALISGGDVLHTWKIMDLLLGCFMLLLAAGGGRTTAAARRVNWGIVTPGRGGKLSPPVFAHAEGPQLTASAVFVGSALVLLALGVLA